jgi:hypothetical protein
MESLPHLNNKKLNINTKPMEFEHLQKRKRKNKVQLMLLGLFLLIGGFFALNGISINNKLSNEVIEGRLKKANEEIETKTDSILNAEQHEKKNQE